MSGTLTMELQAAFGGTWQTADGDLTWTTLERRVEKSRALTVLRGASSATGRADTGTLTTQLLNLDRELDPLNVIAAHATELLPNTPLRWLVTVDGYPSRCVWRGFMPKWPQHFEHTGQKAVVPVNARDGFSMLARAKTPLSLYDLEVLTDTPLAYWKLTDESTEQAFDSSGNAIHGTYRGEPELVDNGLVYGEKSHDFNGTSNAVDVGDWRARLSADVAGPDEGATIEAWFRSTSTPASGQYDTIFNQSGDARQDTLLLAVDDDNRIVFQYTHLGGGVTAKLEGDVTDGEVHHVVISLDYGLPFAYVYLDGVETAYDIVSQDGTQQTAITIGGHPSRFNTRDYFNGEISHVAIYRHALTPARIVAHYEAGLAPLDLQRVDQRIDWLLDHVGWPADLRDLEECHTILGPATFTDGERLLAHMRLLEDSEAARLFMTGDGKLRIQDRYWQYLAPEAVEVQVTFADDATGDVGYATFDLEPADDELIVNSARGSRRGGSEIRVTDEASIAVNGEVDRSFTDLLVGSDAQVESLLQWTVATKAVPTPQITSIRVPIHKYPPATQDRLLALDLGHRVTARITPMRIGDPVDLDVIVDGLRLESDGMELWLDLYVSSAPDVTQSLFILDESELDGADILAF